MPVREKNIMDENNIYKEFSKLRKNEAGNYNDNSYGNKENIYIYIYRSYGKRLRNKNVIVIISCNDIII